MYAASVIKAMLGQSTTGVCPVELLPTDRILQRWSSENGDGLPTQAWDDTPESRPVPLDQDTWWVVNEEIRTSPPKTKGIIKAWYCTPEPTKVIAERLGMSDRGLEKAWHLSLNFMKWRLENTGNRTVLRLLNVRPELLLAVLRVQR